MPKSPLPKGISETLNGKYRVDVTHYHMRYYHTFDDFNDANRCLAQIRANKTPDEFQKQYGVVKELTFQKAANIYIDHRVSTSRSKRVSPTTYNSYAKAIYDAAKGHHASGLSLHNLRPDEIWPKIVKKYSPSYANGIASFHYNMLKHFYDRGLTKAEPVRMGYVPIPEGRKRYLTEDEVKSCEAWLSENAPRYLALFHFYLDTGARKKEAFSLEYNSLTLLSNDRSIIFWGTNTKSGKTRKVQMTHRVYLHVTNDMPWDYAGDERVFGHLSVRTFERLWKQMRQDMGLAGDKDFVIHALRHTCCTRLLAAGVDLVTAQHWMGHKSIQQTAAYAHVMPENLKKAANALSQFDTPLEDTWAR